MSAISAIGGIQHPVTFASVEVVRLKPDAPTDTRRVAPVPDSQSTNRQPPSFSSALGNTIAADLAARAADATEEQDLDAEQLKRQAIGRVFKIDENTDIKAMFGEFELPRAEQVKSSAFQTSLDQLRVPAPEPVETSRFDKSV